MNERMQQKIHHCITKLLSRTTEGMQYLVKIAAARLGTKKFAVACQSNDSWTLLACLPEVPHGITMKSGKVWPVTTKNKIVCRKNKNNKSSVTFSSCNIKTTTTEGVRKFLNVLT